MLKKIILIIMFITLIGFTPIFLIADNKNYEYTKKSILESEEDKRIYDTQSADYIFEYGIELLRAGMYEESLDKFQTLRFSYPNNILSSMSYIYDGIALVRMGREYDRAEKIMEAVNKFDNIIENHTDFVIQPSEDLVHFYVTLSRGLRQVDSPDFRIKGYLEYSVNFFDKDTKNDIYTEIGYYEYLRGNFTTALNTFKEAKTFEAYVGRAKTYSAIGEIDNAIKICSKLKKLVNGEEWKLVDKLLSYYKSLRNSEGNTEGSANSDENYYVNADGKKLNGNYRVYAGSFTNKNTAEKIRKDASETLGIDFTMNKDNGVYKVYSTNVYTYSPAKIKMELLLSSGYPQSFIKDISY